MTPNQQGQTHNPNNLPVAVPVQQNLALITEPDDDGQKLMAQWMSSTPQAVTNLSNDDPESELAMVRAMGKADFQVRQAVGRIMEIVGYVIHPAELTDQRTGEVKCKLRCVLLCRDGSTVSTMSNGVLRVVRVLATTRKQGRWNPPVRAEIKEYPLEGGKTYCILNVLPAQLQANRSAKS